MKKCLRCGEGFLPTGANQKRCAPCKPLNHKEKCLERYQRTYVKKGYSQALEDNNNWRGGIGAYRKVKPKIKCEKCGEKVGDLVHHKDENRYNNDRDNLERVCKRCHQIEHKCWENLPKGEELAKLKRKQAAKATRNHLGQFIKQDT